MTITLEALVHPGEQPAVQHAARLLSTQLGPAQFPVSLHFTAALPPGLQADLIVVSLQADAAALRPDADAWRRRLAPVYGHAGLFLCTALRAGEPGPSAAAAAERARRINRLVAELSRESGAHIIDIDRVFGLLGTRPITAARAADVLAGQVIARCLLAAGLDGIVPASVLDRARAATPGMEVPAR